MAMVSVERIPAVVFGNYVTAWGVIRSLGRAGIPLYWVSEKPDFVKYSRWHRCFPDDVRLPSSPGDLESFLDQLALVRAVVIPCSDHWTRAAVKLPARFAFRFMTSLPDPHSFETLTNKGRLADTLQRYGIPHPKTFPLDNEAQLSRALFSSGFTWFLKPRDSQTFFRHFGRKAFRVRSLDEAVHCLHAASAAGSEMLLQEYVPGPTSQHHFIDGFIDHKGHFSACFARQRHRMYPPDFGDSSYLTSISLSEAKEAVESVRYLFQNLPYRGIFSVEFKRDQRDGEFKLIEVNTRPWVFVEFAAQCGVDVIRMAYDDALGMDVTSITEYAVGRSMSYLPHDILASLALIRRGELSIHKWVFSLLRARSTVFCWDDPIAEFFRWTQLITDKIRKTLS